MMINLDKTSNAKLVEIAQQLYERGKQYYCAGRFRDAGGAFNSVLETEKHLAERIGPDAAVGAVGIPDCDFAWAHYLADIRVPEYRILNLQSPDKRGCPNSHGEVTSSSAQAAPDQDPASSRRVPPAQRSPDD